MTNPYLPPKSAIDDVQALPVGNTSGQGSGAEIPPGVAGWSWGAFLLNWIWAIGNRSWIGLMALIPAIGFFVAVYLGIKGREMAWRNKRWDSVDHFNRVQRTWSKWGIGVVIVLIVGGALIDA